MDEKFNQWCIDRFGYDIESLPYELRQAMKSEYNVERLDAEILELKQRISELEKNK